MERKYAGKVRGGRRRWLCGNYYIDCWRDGDSGIGFHVGIPDSDGHIETEDYSASSLRDALSIAEEMIRVDRDGEHVRPDLYIGRGLWGERLYRVYGAIVAVYPTPDGIVWEGTYTDVYPANTVSQAIDDAEDYFLTLQDS